MAISAYTGLPGSGKSYGVVENVLLPALKTGRLVWTNIPVNADLLLDDGYTLPVQFTIDDILDNPNWFDEILPMGVLLILDEVQLLWPSGLKQNTANSNHIAFLTKHRHLVGENGRSTEIILLTQRLSLTAIFVRGVIEKTLVTYNLALMGTPNRFRVDIFEGSARDVPNIKDRVRDEQGSYKDSIYKYYVSHTLSDNGVGDETRIDNRINFFGGWKFKLFVIFFIFLVFFVYFTSNKFFSSSLSGTTSELKSSNSRIEINPNLHLKKQQHLEPKVVKHTELFLLEQVSEIYISFNQGVYPEIRYEFRLSFEDNISDVDQNTLILMGYKISKFTDCLVKITKKHFQKFVGCKEDIVEDKQDEVNFFESSVSTTVTNQ